MKNRITFHRTRWSKYTFSTPYISINRHSGYGRDKGSIQISFVFYNYHFWIQYDLNKKGGI